MGIEFVLTVIGIPLSLHAGHGALFLPVATALRLLIDAHHEVNGKDGLWTVAEGSKQFGALPFAGTALADKGTAFVSQSFAQVEQDVALTSREGEAAHTAAWGSTHFSEDVVAGQIVTEVTGRSLLIAVAAAIAGVIYRERTSGRHQQQ